MDKGFCTVLRGMIGIAAVGVGLGLGACTAQPSAQAPADTVQTAVAGGASEVRIRDHRGGYLPRVVAELRALNQAGVTARIDGAFCFSSCTVFLAADDVCVAPWTRFGFHAPSDPSSGRKLTGQRFEQATAHVAGYYRPPLAAWWMREGRHTRDGMAFRTGADLIAMGYRACAAKGA